MFLKTTVTDVLRQLPFYARFYSPHCSSAKQRNDGETVLEIIFHFNVS